ncbi:NAD(P)/FAD-dependent oxidoreductase [Sphingosinicella sp.]|uniref:NAD(P)/FAD-dependent oxidoreductase n=1 Tax=Sphingosinicella sp. TaxID=1917971 RepID=UPI0040383AAB
MRRTAALIVGGGPAGAAAAIGLARAGAMPLVIERAAGERDIVCGGFLGWDALARLRQLGLDAAALGARPIHRLRLVAGDKMVERPLPKPAAGLSRRQLDAALLRLAEAEGAMVLRGRTARAVEDRSLRLDDGEEIDADALFVATGKHELRGTARQIGDRAVSVGLRAALPASPTLARDLAGVIELHLYDGGYAGLLLQEDGMVNLCLSAAQARMGDGREALLASLWQEAPRLAERVGAPPTEWEAIAGVPYGWRAKATDPGVYRVGDQAAVIASLAGDGIAIALASGIAAAQACLKGDGKGARDYQKAFARRALRPVKAAEALRHMAEHRRERPVMMALARIGGLAGLAARMTRIG